MVKMITMQPRLYTGQKVEFPVYASAKLRGVRGYYWAKRNKIYSRNGKVYNGLSHLLRPLSFFMEDVDGEILVPGIPFETGTGLIRRGEETPNAVFCMFDLPSYKKGFETRYLMYRKLYELYYYDKAILLPVYHKIIRNKQELESYYKYLLNQGYEGLVLKKPNSPYIRGYTAEWLKMKEKDTFDLKVVGMYEGKGKYKGMLGGLICKFGNREVKVGGGFTDIQRKNFWQFPGLIMSMTIEVSAQEKTNKRSLRNPNFVRVRYDK